MTCETVPLETPAARATSSMVGWVRLPGKWSSGINRSLAPGPPQQAEAGTIGCGHAVFAVIECGEGGQVFGAKTGREPRRRRHRHQRRIGRKTRLDSMRAARCETALRPFGI